MDWPAWVTWERALLLLSLAANGILGIAAFFKSAINGIVVEWWKERRALRGKRHEVLRELNHRLTTFDRSHLQLMVGLGMQHMATTAQDMALATRTFEDAVREFGQTNDFFEKHALEFPLTVRRLVADLQRTAMLDADAVRRVIPREELLRRSDEVHVAIERIRSEVERIVA